MREKIESLKEELYRAGYICCDKMATVLYLAETMEKPILVEGPAGVGKTALARAYSTAKALPEIRLQCYEGINESTALYEWNYKKQLLHIQARSRPGEEAKELEKEIFSEEYLLPRPLLQAIAGSGGSVLLIDEIDKVDFEFEALLLELLSDYQVTIPEMGTYRARQIPRVFLTSNATRELSEALKRRCLYMPLSYPAEEMENRILELQVPGIEAALRSRLVKAVRGIRQLDLKKPPSLAESIDWARSLVCLGIKTLDREIFLETATVLLKNVEDLESAERSLTFVEDELRFIPRREMRRDWS